MKETKEKSAEYLEKLKKTLQEWNESPDMKLKDLKEKIDKNEIVIDFKHHNFVEFKNYETVLKVFKEEFEDSYNRAIESVEALPDNMFALMKVYAPLEIGRYIDTNEFYCWDCGARLKPVLIENTLSFISIGNFYDQADKAFAAGKIANKYDYKLELLNDCPPCELHKYNIVDKIVTEIDVPTGELVIKNFFKTEKLYKIENESEKLHSINSLLGRVQLAESLQKYNVGYGQMGNMSIGVYKKKDDTEILFATDYRYDEEKNEESFEEYPEYIYLGEISLDVWRWQCADMQVLKEHGEELPEDVNYNKKAKHHYYDAIIANVKPGRWVIEHYYDIHATPESKYIYSKLFLKDNK